MDREKHSENNAKNQQVMSTSKRDNSLDAIAGILILYMVAVHSLMRFELYGGDVKYCMYLLTFYMPWFFYKAGMLWHVKNFNQVVGGGNKRLLKPFVTYSIIGYLVYVISLVVVGDYNWIHYTLTPVKSLLLSGSVSGNEPLWFLLSLFIVRIIGNETIGRFKNCGKIAIAFLCVILGWGFNAFGIFKPDWMLNITTGYAFFLLGHLLRKVQYARYVFPLSAILYVTAWFTCFASVEMRHNLLECGIYPVWPIVCIVGMVLINNLFKRIPLSDRNPLVGIGRNSLTILVWHYPILQLFYIITQI